MGRDEDRQKSDSQWRNDVMRERLTRVFGHDVRSDEWELTNYDRILLRTLHITAD